MIRQSMTGKAMMKEEKEQWIAALKERHASNQYAVFRKKVIEAIVQKLLTTGKHNS